MKSIIFGCIAAATLLTECGYKTAPTPIYETTSSRYEEEIETRQKEAQLRAEKENDKNSKKKKSEKKSVGTKDVYEQGLMPEPSQPRKKK